jgi:hypothetical protein
MNNFKVLGLTILFLVLVLLVKANSPYEINYAYHSYDFGEFYNFEQIENEIEQIFYEDNEVKVLDSNEQLVAEGSSQSLIIKSYITVSDMLLEIDGVKYYRLSYK